MPDKTRTLIIQGAGRVSRVPDRMILNISLVHRAQTTEEAMMQLQMHYQNIVNHCEHHGFSLEDIHTSSINVVTGYSEHHESYVECSQAMTLESVLDMNRLAVMLDGLKQDDDFNFSLSYQLSDDLGARNEAVQAAIIDARGLAEVIASGSGVKLGHIAKIEYGDLGVQPIGVRMMNAEMHHAVNPHMLTVSQTIQIVWTLKD